MQEVHARLREWGSPERLEIFDGTHTWMPAPLARQAVEWMEVQAMKRGLRETDETLATGLYGADLAQATDLETDGRLLETLATSAGYYLAGDLMRQGEDARAAVALTMALEARPDRPYLWYNLACCRARTGARGAALDALEEAVAHGFSDSEILASDTDLESLRGEDRFRTLVDSLRTAR